MCFVPFVYNCNNTAHFTAPLSAYVYTQSPPYLRHLAYRENKFYNPYQTYLCYVSCITALVSIFPPREKSLNL
jgi:hypothetical protein